MQIEQIEYSKIITNLIQKNIESLFKGIYRKGEEKYNEILISTGRAFENYLNTAVLKFNSVKTILYHHKPVPLYDFYVHVYANCNNDRINTEKVENLLNYSNCITMFGTGGIGKSTLFKHLFLNTIESTDYIPIFVELKDVGKKDYTRIEDFIYDVLKNLNFTLDKELFIDSLHSGKYVIFFDAFDEVKEDKKPFISEEINRLTTQYMSNHYFVSSRPNAMLERGWDNFSDFNVEPLNSKKSIELIENLQYDTELKNRFLLTLKDGKLLTTHKSFCSNPLLLTIMLLTYEEFAEIPDKLHIFYSKAFDVLYSKHDATKGSFVREKRFEKKGLASDDFENVLSAFSAISYSESNIAFSRDMLVYYIKKAKEFTEIDFDINDFEIDMVEAVCILAVEGLEYKYQHRSFQEYFTAKFINNLTDEEQKEFLESLLEQNPSSIKDEIFNMLFEINKIKFEQNFLIPFLNKIKDLMNNDVNNELNQIYFLQNMYSFVTLSGHFKILDGQGKVEVDNVSTRFRIKPSNGMFGLRYMHVIRFAIRKYGSTVGDVVPRLNMLEKKNLLKEIFKRRIDEVVMDDSELNRNILNLRYKDAEKDEQILKDIISCSEGLIADLKLSLIILEKLEEKHANNRSIKDLFRKKPLS